MNIPFKGISKIVKGSVPKIPVGTNRQEYERYVNSQISEINSLMGHYGLSKVEFYPMGFAIPGRRPIDLTGSTDSFTVNLMVSQAVPKTFKLFDMDVTEDFDVVVRGANATIFVTNIVDGLREAIVNVDSSYKGSGFEIAINPSSVSELISKFKFGRFDTNTIYDIFDSFVSSGKSLRAMVSRSIILSYILGKESKRESVSVSTGAGPESNIPFAFADYFKKAYKFYKILRGVVSALDFYFSHLSSQFGDDAISSALSGCASEGDMALAGRFRGFHEGYLSETASVMFSPENDAFINELMDYIAVTKTGVAQGKYSHKKRDIMATMTGLCDSYSDYTNVNDETMKVAAMLDYVKYKDDDLVIVSSKWGIQQ
jgi:hypothetical protein